MRSFSFLILFIFAAVLAAETVYKTVDEDGNIIFTDKPSADSEEIKIKELQTIENPNPAKYKAPAKQATVKDVAYSKLSVTSPENGAGIRNNAGNIRISVALEPGLKPGHRLVILMDGKEVSTGSATSVSLNNVDRGSHSIAVSVVDGNGKKLISSSSSFSLLRASK